MHDGYRYQIEIAGDPDLTRRRTSVWPHPADSGHTSGPVEGGTRFVLHAGHPVSPFFLMPASPTVALGSACDDAVDQPWGDLLSAGTYLVYGTADHDRRVLGLRLLQAGSRRGAAGLYVSCGPTGNLRTVAAELGLDLPAAHADGRIKLLRFAPPPPRNGDVEATHALADLAALVLEHRPAIVVVDDFEPFTAFHSDIALQAAFIRMIKDLSPAPPAMLLSLPAPRTADARRRLAVLAPLVTEVIEVASSDKDGTNLTLLRHTPRGNDTDLPTLHASTGDGAWVPADASAPIDRDSFALRLQTHFHRRAVRQTPFLLVAVRGDDEAARALDFDLLLRSIRALIDDPRDLLADPASRRLIVLLPEGRAPDATRFFARLKQHLYQNVSEQAGDYLSTFSALVLPDGAPFSTAEDFLISALGDDL